MTVKQILMALGVFAFVFVATIAVAAGIHNHTFSGPSLGDQINVSLTNVQNSRRAGTP